MDKQQTIQKLQEMGITGEKLYWNQDVIRVYLIWGKKPYPQAVADFLKAEGFEMGERDSFLASETWMKWFRVPSVDEMARW